MLLTTTALTLHLTPLRTLVRRTTSSSSSTRPGTPALVVGSMVNTAAAASGIGIASQHGLSLLPLTHLRLPLHRLLPLPSSSLSMHGCRLSLPRRLGRCLRPCRCPRLLLSLCLSLNLGRCRHLSIFLHLRLLPHLSL
jgi:hypothetical protein